MTAKQHIKCPVCGADDFTVKYEPWADASDPVKLYGAASGVQGTQRLVTCAACAMIYENPRFPDEIILAGYTSSEEGGHDSQYRMRVQSFHRALVKLARRLPPKGSRILDIGTAGGAFLDAADRFGYQAFGLEPSKFLAEQGNGRGLKIQRGTIVDHPFEPASFDMVCLWDVIEHLTDPKGALVDIRRLLRADGILLINFPDIGTWQARLAGRRFWWLLSVHLHHFKRKTISEICVRTGFETFHFQRYWQTLEFGYLERMAAHLGIPLAALITRLTPASIQRIPIPYYASQTTALARLAS